MQTRQPFACEDGAVEDGPEEGGMPDGVPRRIESLTRLARVTSELAMADTVDAVSKIVTYHIADAVGATIAALALREGDQVRLIGLRGLRADEAGRWETFPLERATPASEVIRTGTRLVLVGASEISARYPELPDVDRGERTVVAVPLRVTGRTIGCIALSFPGADIPDDAELDFLEIMADTCAQAFRRIEASAVAEKQTARLAFLAEASIELASSLDLDVTIAKVTRLAVPAFADWCAIDVVRDGRLHRLAVAHVDPEKVQLAIALQERWPPDASSSSGVWAVVRSGRPDLIREITDDMLVAGARDEEHLRVARELDLRSALVVPLLVRHRVIGALTWVSSDPERLYDHDDVRFAEHLARRAATAIDNSELYSQTLAAAEQLQRAVLPERVVGTEGWEVASEYHPSGRTEVGGDFYDAFPLDDGRFVIFLGDVMGRGVSAAAAMAQVRAAVRAFASVDPSPALVVTKVDQMLAHYGTEQLVTLLYLVADGKTGTLTTANAGHPPPVVLRAEGHAEQLPFADGPPLGVAPMLRRQTTLPFAVGDTLLAYTDGLVERRDEDIDAGLSRLVHAVPELADASLTEALRRVVGTVRDVASDDDAAVLVLRRTG
jgi:serine phosphatase RsbU (regulator of sigma subunit)